MTESEPANGGCETEDRAPRMQIGSIRLEGQSWVTVMDWQKMVSYFNMIRAGDITFHQHGWPINVTLESAKGIWADQEHKMRSALEGAMKPVFPRLVRVGSESELDPECQGSMLKMLLGVRSMKTWAINMMDASGKLPNGIFSGTSAVFGNFDQCLSIAVGDLDDGGFRGKYCYVKTTAPNLPRPSLEPSNVIADEESILNWFYTNAYWIQQFGTRMGVCVPSHCSDEDVTRMVTYVFSSINAEGRVIHCYEDQPQEFDGVQLFVLLCISTFSFFIFICTVAELFPFSRHSFVHEALTNFSVISNSRQLFQTKESKRDIKILHGIRVISCAWIILGHIYFFTDLDSFARFGSLRKLEELFANFLFTAVENFSLPVDSFFAITGLLLMWTHREDEPFSIRSWFSKMWHRIYRIYPCYLLLHGLCVLLPSLGNGPIWKETFSTISRNMYSTSWTDFLFCNNFIHWNDNVMVHTWFIALNVQLCIIGIPLAHFLRRNTRLTVIGMTIASLFGCFLASGLIYFNQYPPTMLMMTSQYERAIDFISYVYYMPSTHLAPFCLGMILGHLLVEGCMPKFNNFILLLGNTVSFLCMFAAVFGAYPFRAGWAIDYIWVALYGGFHRVLWTLPVCWFILVSQTGQGGTISAFLSANFWQPFSSLSFAAYLLHPLPILLYVASTREIQQLDHFYLTIFFLGIWCLSHILAYVAYVTVELPFSGLERLLRSRGSLGNPFSSKSTELATVDYGSSKGMKIHAQPSLHTTRTDDCIFQFDSGITTRYKL
ncbi:nose resistant to fluoxetine protein 6 [Galendromus occidentalis]|uniref:Nose resistant to fluoxetine protein 6 n=1 Tax=Galendromus occidentalis TaxID=34638 RepID=A0AAJ7L571_9ACAR|nr:nose resistant to fluoxetine protein 6 [Galendromus occidentalis]